MKVFISWSGTTSRAVAEALHWWLPKVLQGIKPFVSAKDIDKGSNWTVELARELEETQFGVICVTPDNLGSPWLNYETGAITRSVESRVCPVLHGVRKGEVAPPLGQLQLTDFDKDDVLLMMASMNAVAGDLLSETDLADAVDMWWPRLEVRLNAITPATAAAPVLTVTHEPDPPKSSQQEMLEQLLELVRRIERRVAPTPPPPRRVHVESDDAKSEPEESREARVTARRMFTELLTANDYTVEGTRSARKLGVRIQLSDDDPPISDELSVALQALADVTGVRASIVHRKNLQLFGTNKYEEQ